MTRLLCCVVMQCTLALPAAAHAQTCLGFPIQARAAVGAQLLVADQWIGYGARGGIAASRSVALRADGELLHHDQGANGAQLTVLIGLEGAAPNVFCAYINGSLFRRDAIMSDFDPGDMTGRSGAIGVGLARWLIGRRVDVLLHTAAEGVVMRRNRTGDGAFVVVLGGGVALRRWYFGAAWKTSTPFDVLLTRDHGASRVLLHTSVDIGR